MASNNNGSFVPFSIPSAAAGAPVAPPPPAAAATPKPILGHVVQASSTSAGGTYGETGHKEKYKWHTVVDGFSK